MLSGAGCAILPVHSRYIETRCVRRCSIRCLPRSPACRASARSWRSCSGGCSAAGRGAARSSTCCSICRAARSTAGRGRSCATSCPTPWSPSRCTVDRHRAAAAASLARALSDLCQRRHRRHHPDVLQRAPGLSRKAAAGRRASLRLRHRRALRRHAADGASRPRGVGGRPRQAAADRAGLSADRGAEPQSGAQGGRCRAGARARSRRMAGRDWLARAHFPPFAQALRSVHRPGALDDLLPESPAWSRLAYRRTARRPAGAGAGARAHPPAGGPRRRGPRRVCARS